MNINRFLSRRNFLQTLLMASGATAINWTGLGAIADEIPSQKKGPVVVIGAGLGGLVAAAYLSKFGFQVTILEQHGIPGGYATSFYRKNGKYCFDVSLHATVAEHAQPQRILTEIGVWEKLQLVWTPEFRRIVTPKTDVTLPAKNPKGVKTQLSRVFPHEKKGIHAFYSEMEAVVNGLWQRKKSSITQMEKLEKLTLKQWMAQHVNDPEVTQCLAVFSGYYGLEPAKINALFYAIATGEYLVHGGQYYKTRSQDLSNSLAKAVEDNGGKIYYRSRVNEILFDDNNILKAVKDAKGNVYSAESVVANCSVPTLMNAMLPQSVVPSAYRAKIKQRNNSLSSVVVWLGLKANIAHLVKDYEIDLLQDHQDLKNSLLSKNDPAESNISITIYDNLFKDYSQPGTTTMSIMCLSDYEFWRKFETNYFKGDKGAYRQEKKRIAAQLIKRVEEKLIPGLREMVEVMVIGTPLTNRRYTGNTDGAIYGFDRDLPHLEPKTPVQGLYLASAWSHGGGYTPVMMAGHQAAKAILEDYQS